MLKARRNIRTRFSRRWQRVLLSIGIMLVSFTAHSQVDTTSNEFQRSFDDFLNNSQQEFEAFKSSNDSVFYGFLKKAWQEYELFIDEKPAIPKPKDQPELKIKEIKSREIQPVIRKTMLQDSGKQLQLHLAPSNYDEYGAAKEYHSIKFYGTRIDVFKVPSATRLAPPFTKDKIADFFIDAVNNDELIYAVYDLYNKASHKNLNKWGFIRLLQDASASLYGDLNERVLFTWTALIKTGHDARIGLKEDELFLLVNFDVPVYYSQYLMKGNKKYYLVNFDGQDKKSESLTSVKADYPAELDPVSLLIESNPLLQVREGTRKVNYKGNKHSLSYDVNLVDFFRAYPDCDLSIYFRPPLSETSLSSLDDLFLPLLKNKTDREQVNVLLDFIQHGLAYDTDNKQFGYENYLFAEEAVYYPSIDCEDRTVLLSQLINHYLDLETVALGFPGHVSLAVNLSEESDGSFIRYNNEKYYVCDPTYIGSACGMLMPEFNDVNPEVITY